MDENETGRAETGPGEVTAMAVQAPGMEGLIARAIDKGVSVESLERLLAMRDRLRQEQAREAFFEALSAFQSDCPIIPKTRTARVESRTGGSYTYHYAPLEGIVKVVSPLLRRHGLSFKFDTRFEANPPAQVVICTVYHRDGHSESSEFRAPIDGSARMNDMQKSASSLTYAKRYAFCNAFGILTGDDDDDGQGAGGGDFRRGGPTVRVAPGGTRPVAPAPPSAPPPARQPVRIRPVARAQDSDGQPTATGFQPVAETPAPSPPGESPSQLEQKVEQARVSEQAKAELRRRLIEGQMRLLRPLPKYQDYSNDELWNRAVEVLDVWCDNSFRRKLHELTMTDLGRAMVRMDEFVEQRGLA